MEPIEMDIFKLFKTFEEKKVLIIGDVMIDAYLYGKVTRISPEAPVPVVDVTCRESRLGGAANVALNIKSLQANPILCSVIGDDDAGLELMQLLSSNEMATKGLMTGINRKTTIKYRIIGNSVQMLRIDEETNHPLTLKEEKMFLCNIFKILSEENIDVIVFQDYDKGSITPNIIKELVQWANENNVPTAVDPKKRNFVHYKNVTLFKPNLKEMIEGLALKTNVNDIDAVKKHIKQLHEKLHSVATMVTLSEHGIAIQSKDHFSHIPAHPRHIVDVSGAGDTVISVAALCICCGLNSEVTAALSNLAGGLVCEHVGIVSIDKSLLLSEAKKILNPNMR